MEKELLRYINILKTVQEIKESIEELKFGSRMKHDWMYCTYILKDMCIWDWENDCDIQIKGFKTFEIIWQVEERHLRMFMNKRGILFYMGRWLFVSEWWIKMRICKIDNKKPHMEQSEEFYKKISDWIVTEFWIDESEL